uniref:Uncharacterized protein n=1 Tax=Pseudomonas phage Baskent_P1_112 TaxID=3145032 RepID=A0AAU8BCS6_9CAUD
MHDSLGISVALTSKTDGHSAKEPMPENWTN